MFQASCCPGLSSCTASADVKVGQMMLVPDGFNVRCCKKIPHTSDKIRDLYPLS